MKKKTQKVKVEPDVVIAEDVTEMDAGKTEAEVEVEVEQ